MISTVGNIDFRVDKPAVDKEQNQEDMETEDISLAKKRQLSESSGGQVLTGKFWRGSGSSFGISQVL